MEPGRSALLSSQIPNGFTYYGDSVKSPGAKLQILASQLTNIKVRPHRTKVKTTQKPDPFWSAIFCIIVISILKWNMLILKKISAWLCGTSAAKQCGSKFQNLHWARCERHDAISEKKR